MRRLLWAPVLLCLACGQTESLSDGGPGPRADAQAPDATPAADAAAIPDAGEPEDASEPSCGPGEVLDGGECVDLDECLDDNGGCGDPAHFECQNQDRAPPVCRYDPSTDWGFLTDGVARIDSGGALPSSMVVHGPMAFGVIFDENERPFVTAARHGDGRVVVFGHEAHLGGLLDNDSDVDQLAANAIRWTTRADAPVVATLTGFGDFLRFAEGLGYPTRTVSVDDLGEVDLLVVAASRSRTEAEWTRIRDWVADGGGLLVGGQAWYWSYSNDDTATAYPANVLLNPVGLTYTPYSHVTAGEDTVDAEPPGRLRHARDALDALLAHLDGARPLSADEIALAVGTVTLAVDTLPVGPFAEYFGRAAAYESTVGPIVIEDGSPLVRADAPLEALAVVIAAKLALEAPADQLRAHPMGDSFPGAVAAEAPRIDRTLTIDGTHAGLHRKYAYANARSAAMRSTGLYAAPGDVITVTIPAAVVDAGLGVQIGAHTDRLFNKDEWRRYPRTVRRDALEAVQTRVGSGLGGPIYITVPIDAALGPVEVTVSGGVEMPWFELGTSDPAAWATQRDAPAPWAELGSDKLIITVPSAAVRNLEDPQALLQFWDRVLDSDADLSGYSRDRPRAERFVFDRQISAGWMHSGYPIMAHLASVPEAVDLATLSTDGSWGLFHELGHNHQWRDWVLPGTTEANVNLFSVYAMELIVNRSRDVAHSALDPADRRTRTADYLATGPDFSRWSVWTALESYLQLQEAFGWTPLTDAFVAYRSLPDPPGNDAERIDEWMIQMSRATGRDLSGFFLAWGHPLTATATAAVSNLPPWTDHPLAGP